MSSNNPFAQNIEEEYQQELRNSLNDYQPASSTSASNTGTTTNSAPQAGPRPTQRPDVPQISIDTSLNVDDSPPEVPPPAYSEIDPHPSPQLAPQSPRLPPRPSSTPPSPLPSSGYQRQSIPVPSSSEYTRPAAPHPGLGYNAQSPTYLTPHTPIQMQQQNWNAPSYPPRPVSPSWPQEPAAPQLPQRPVSPNPSCSTNIYAPPPKPPRSSAYPGRTNATYSSRRS